MKRRIRYMALLLAVCMLALTGCAQPRDTMTLRVCLDAAPATLDPPWPPPTPSARWWPTCLKIS